MGDNERKGPVEIYINVIMGDVTNSSVVQGGTGNNASASIEVPYDLLCTLLAHIQGLL